MTFSMQRAANYCFQVSRYNFFIRNIVNKPSAKQYLQLFNRPCRVDEKYFVNISNISKGEKFAFNKETFFNQKRGYLGKELKEKNRSTLYYSLAFVAFVGGFTYASVLLYRIYCQSTGKGGRAIKEDDEEKISAMKPVKDRYITVNFCADTNSAMMWNFKPQQPNIKVSPGETALAFYSAKNPSNKAITGIATYNVLPFEAGKYFNKIQCFCFEEQQLNPNEEVDMPVFFYLDPEFANDPWLENVNDIILSYTFFEAKEGMHLPRPAFV